MKHQLIALTAAATLAAGMLWAQGPAPGSRQEKRLEMLATLLNLTDAQKGQAQTIFSAAHQAAQPVRQQLAQNHQAMAEAVKAGNEPQIDSLSASQGTLMGQMISIHGKAFSKFYAILTPDQRAKADKLHGMLRGMFQNRFGGPGSPDEHL